MYILPALPQNSQISPVIEKQFAAEVLFKNYFQHERHFKPVTTL